MTRIEKIIIGMIVTIVIGLTLLITTVIIPGCQEIEKKGLKNVINDVWEGEDHEDQNDPTTDPGTQRQRGTGESQSSPD